jgi:hypothetical protein
MVKIKKIKTGNKNEKSSMNLIDDILQINDNETQIKIASLQKYLDDIFPEYNAIKKNPDVIMAKY